MTIKAISFDIWDTLVIDDSDEPKRKRMGLPTKTDDRIAKIFAVAQRYNPRITLADTQNAYKENLAQFSTRWHEDYVTEKVPERLRALFALLKIDPSPNDLNAAAFHWEEMEFNIPPDPAAYIAEVLKQLCKDYKLGIISDAIVSPGRVLRKVLDRYDLLKYFSVFTFSDEVGASKPSPKVFQHCLTQLGCRPDEVVHIGDRPYNDIDGPKDSGMRAILYDGIKKRTLERHTPDAVCSDYKNLPEIIRRLF